MKKSGVVFLAAAAVFLTACGNSGDPAGAVPEPGRLIVSLETPNADDGAILISISGTGIASPTAEASSQNIYFRSTGASSVNMAVIGNLADGPLLRFSVPDVNRASSYVATVVEVADRQNEVRTSVDTYNLEIQAEGVGGS